MAPCCGSPGPAAAFTCGSAIAAVGVDAGSTGKSAGAGDAVVAVVALVASFAAASATRFAAESAGAVVWRDPGAI